MIFKDKIRKCWKHQSQVGRQLQKEGIEYLDRGESHFRYIYCGKKEKEKKPGNQKHQFKNIDERMASIDDAWDDAVTQTMN